MTEQGPDWSRAANKRLRASCSGLDPPQRAFRLMKDCSPRRGTRSTRGECALNECESPVREWIGASFARGSLTNNLKNKKRTRCRIFLRYGSLCGRLGSPDRLKYAMTIFNLSDPPRNRHPGCSTDRFARWVLPGFDQATIPQSAGRTIVSSDEFLKRMTRVSAWSRPFFQKA